jgi:hypothetical protein
MLRNLLRIASRVGMPGTLLSLGDAGGRVLYLSAEMNPLAVVVGMEHEDVLQLHDALSRWLREQADREAPAPFGRQLEPVPLVAGAIGRGRIDASTVQLRTVGDADQDVSGVHSPGPRRSPV